MGQMGARWSKMEPKRAKMNPKSLQDKPVIIRTGSAFEWEHMVDKIVLRCIKISKMEQNGA